MTIRKLIHSPKEIPTSMDSALDNQFAPDKITELRTQINQRFADAVNYLLVNRLAHNKNEIMASLGLYLGRLSLILVGKANVSTDNIAMLSVRYGVSARWILTGLGSIMEDGTGAPPTPSQSSDKVEKGAALSSDALPLIPLAALAGFNGIDEPGVRLSDCVQYVVPEFVQSGADFLIRVQGTSMVPTFQSGDVVACHKLETGAWIDYGDPYVIDGAQGIMVKRLYNDVSNPDKLLCKSDNPDVAPFSISKTEVRSLSKVLGIVRSL